MKLQENRMDASMLSPKERAQLPSLLDFARRAQHPSLKAKDGTEIALPQALFDLLVKVVEDIRHGKAIVLMPEQGTFTTQAAANMLGMSRQYFVTLLEKGQIPFHRVGSHRRVYFKDLHEYSQKRDAERRSGLNGLFKKLRDEKQYDTDYTGEDA